MLAKAEARKWIEKNWGQRCPDFNPECGLCQAWFCFDFIFQEGMWHTHRMKIVKEKKV
jgi:hypothetical protein